MRSFQRRLAGILEPCREYRGALFTVSEDYEMICERLYNNVLSFEVATVMRQYAPIAAVS